MFSFFKLVDLLEEISVEEQVWAKLAKPTNPYLVPWKEKLMTAIARRKAYMKSKAPIDKELYRKAFQSAQVSKQKALQVIQRQKTGFLKPQTATVGFSENEEVRR